MQSDSLIPHKIWSDHISFRRWRGQIYYFCGTFLCNPTQKAVQLSKNPQSRSDTKQTKTTPIFSKSTKCLILCISSNPNMYIFDLYWYNKKVKVSVFFSFHPHCLHKWSQSICIFLCVDCKYEDHYKSSKYFGLPYKPTVLCINS